MYNLETKFSEVADEWLEFHRAKVKNNTYLMYLRYVKYLKMQFENQTLTEILPIHIQKMLNNLFAINYAKSTIGKYRLTLQQIFNYGIKINCATKNSCDGTYIPKGATVKKVTCVCDEYVEKILCSYDKPFGLFALVLMTFGLRRSEALALTWEDFNIDDGYLTVSKIIEYDKSKPVVCNYLKNGDEKRIIPILPIALPIIKEKKDGKHGIIFSRDGEYLQRSRVEKEWGKYLKITGMEMNKHQLRHTYATLLYKAGVDMKTAMILMGHHDINMLMKIYTHTDREMLTLGAANLSAYITNHYFAT